MKELVKASVKYNDMLGSFAVDMRDSGLNSFKKLLELHDFDFSKYHPYAYCFTMGEAREKAFDLQKAGVFQVYAVSIEEVGKTEEAISKAAMENGDMIPTYLFFIDMSAQEFFALFKRVELILSVSKHRNPGDTGFLIDRLSYEELGEEVV